MYIYTHIYIRIGDQSEVSYTDQTYIGIIYGLCMAVFIGLVVLVYARMAATAS